MKIKAAGRQTVVITLPTPNASFLSYLTLWGTAVVSQKYAQKRMSALLAKARKAGARATTLLLEGVAHEQIIRAAKSKKADLIVMGTHGHTGIVKFFVGSIASRVVAGAPCPVLTVRGRASGATNA